MFVVMQKCNTKALLLGLLLKKTFGTGAEVTNCVDEDKFGHLIKVGYDGLFPFKRYDVLNSCRIALDATEDISGDIGAITALFPSLYYATHVLFCLFKGNRDDERSSYKEHSVSH